MKNNFLSKVFLWLCIGLLVSFRLGYALLYSEDLRIVLLINFSIVAIAEIVVALIFSF
jgi:FtsH-binding integral membrane protein